MNDYHLLTQIKNDVENKRLKKYQQIKQKNTNKYFELYLNKIIFIQRYWRKHLVSKALQMERLSIKQINKNSLLKQQNLELKNRLFFLKKRRQQLENIDVNQQAALYKNQLQNQLRISLKNVFEGADKSAKIMAVLKSEMMGYRQIVKQNESLKKDCQQSSFKAQSLKQKNRKLCEKVKVLQNKIAEEKGQILRLKQKNKEIGVVFFE